MQRSSGTDSADECRLAAKVEESRAGRSQQRSYQADPRRASGSVAVVHRAAVGVGAASGKTGRLDAVLTGRDAGPGSLSGVDSESTVDDFHAVLTALHCASGRAILIAGGCIGSID